MRKQQKLIDFILNIITYVTSLISIIVLISIVVFLFSKGFSHINLDILSGKYWSENKLVKIEEEYNKSGNYKEPELFDGYFSSKWGIALNDEITSEKEHVTVITYIDENSPFNYLYDASSNQTDINKISIDVGYRIQKYDYYENDYLTFNGRILKQTSEETVNTLDDLSSIDSIYLKSQGGGIFGSLIATLYLIVVSLLIALPIGISSAIYLNEYASKTKFNSLIRSGIETLTGVPSIVYGLMGITVLFPITQLFNINTTSILLGALTMSIILLPTIIRSCEEALIVVPKELRDASESLGATKSQTIFKVVLPICVNGILTGVLLSIGRVIGESAALIYTMGTFINDTPSLSSQGTSLSLMIWTIMSGEQPNFELASAISLIILFIVFILNLIVKLIGKKFAKSFA